MKIKYFKTLKEAENYFYREHTNLDWSGYERGNYHNGKFRIKAIYWK